MVDFSPVENAAMQSSAERLALLAKNDVEIQAAQQNPPEVFQLELERAVLAIAEVENILEQGNSRSFGHFSDAIRAGIALSLIHRHYELCSTSPDTFTIEKIRNHTGVSNVAILNQYVDCLEAQRITSDSLDPISICDRFDMDGVTPSSILSLETSKDGIFTIITVPTGIYRGGACTHHSLNVDDHSCVISVTDTVDSKEGASRHEQRHIKTKWAQNANRNEEIKLSLYDQFLLAKVSDLDVMVPAFKLVKMFLIDEYIADAEYGGIMNVAAYVEYFVAHLTEEMKKNEVPMGNFREKMLSDESLARTKDYLDLVDATFRGMERIGLLTKDQILFQFAFLDQNAMDDLYATLQESERVRLQQQ